MCRDTAGRLACAEERAGEGGGSHRPRSIELLVPVCTAAVVAVKVSVGRARQQPQQVCARTLLTNALVSLAGRNSCCPSLQEPPAHGVPCAIRRVGGILRRGSAGNDEENAGRNCHRDDVCASAGHVPASCPHKFLASCCLQEPRVPFGAPLLSAPGTVSLYRILQTNSLARHH